MESNTNTTSPHSKFVHSVLAVVVLALLALSSALIFQYKDLKEQLSGTNGTEYAPENTRVLLFLDDFVNLVLGSTTEISLEDRLRLENEVRALGDKEILATWQAFTEAPDDMVAQGQVIKLLRLLVAKLKEAQ
ncbi:MAG TPA: hypothetical protein VJB98_01870 [Candidatus Paceibacterota bacterium]